jgi:hypothetical protein
MQLADFIIKNGGAKGSRTPDLLNAIQALYQLSYGPISVYNYLHSHSFWVAKSTDLTRRVAIDWAGGVIKS